MNKNKVKVSVIVPAYNEENHIGKCLDSLLKQSITEMQIIVVDDGSTDYTYKICEEYCATSKGKIEIIKKKNEGLGFARNTGLLYARGEYIGFVDSDDWIDPDMYLQMYNNAKRYDSDISVCDICKYSALDQQVEYLKVMDADEGIIDIKDFFLKGKYPQVVWNKLYKADLWKDYKFRNIYFEDLDLIMEIISNIQTLSYVPKAFYYYYRHYGSISVDYSGVKYFDKFIAYENIIRRVKKSFQEEVIYWVVKNCLDCINRKELYAFEANFIDFIKEKKELILNNSYLKKDTSLDSIYDILRLELISKNIFVEDKKNSRNRKLKEYVRDFNFYQVKPMDVQNSSYVAVFLGEIYKKGGFFVNENVIIQKPIGKFRFHEIILFWNEDNQICMDVIGGKEKSWFLQELLLRLKQNFDIQGDIRRMLIEIGAVFNGKSQILNETVAIYDWSVFCEYFQYL